MAEELSIEQLARTYLKLRNAIEEREDAHKADMQPLKDQFEVVSAALLGICNTQNLDSVKTPAGTVTRRTTSRYWTNDWAAMHDFIKEHDALELLENRIHTKHMKDFLAENPDLLPMGLQANTKYAVQVRKPTKA